MRRVIVLLAAGLAVCSIVGCKDKSNWFSTSKPASGSGPDSSESLPIYRQNTVAEYSTLDGPVNIQVSGYGLVVGLGDKGSSEVPANVESYLKDYLLKRGVGSWREGTQMVTPEMILRDKDTAVVLIGGTLPPMAPAGTRFDLFVTALPGTQTTSLDGGYLMPIDLYVAVGGRAVPTGGSKRMAEGAGSIFVNPFIDIAKSKELPKLREGRILNGGKSLQPPSVKLVLRQADFHRSSYIQRRINERFRDTIDKVAKGTSTGVIELTTPPQFKDDHMHFLELVLHMPLVSGAAAYDQLAREIGRAMQQPDANYRELALVWEAIGRQILPIIQPLYTCRNSVAAYYAAQTGLRLGDEAAIEVIISHALNPNSPVRMTAIEELGRQSKYIRGTDPLQQLLNDPAESIRVAAYEALLHREDCTAIERINVGGHFSLDLVKSNRSYVVYATQTGEPRIVLFGESVALGRDVFFSSPDDLVTINSEPEKEKVVVFRKIPRTGRFSEPFEITRDVKTLILTLGSLPVYDEAGKIKGLNLSYGQVVGVLYRLCKKGSIPAKFVLQPLPEVQQIYRSTPSFGRSDTAENRPDDQK